MTTHSQLPWKLEDADCIIDNRGKTTAVCVNEFSEANASFIVKAVNNHERLVKAVQSILAVLKNDVNGEWDRTAVYKQLQQALQSVGNCAGRN